MGVDAKKLRKELEALQTENASVERKIQADRESLTVRAQIKKHLSATHAMYAFESLAKDIAGTPHFYGLSIEEIREYGRHLDMIFSTCQEIAKYFKKIMAEIKQGGGLRVVADD